MLRTYLDWLLDVPWTRDHRRPPRPGRGARACSTRTTTTSTRSRSASSSTSPSGSCKGDMKGPILCFVGPPGVGKTSLGQSIARAMNRKFVRISLGGVRDEAEIRGHRRTYIGSMPGRIVQALKQAGVDESGVHARRDRQDRPPASRAIRRRRCSRCSTRRRTTPSATTTSRVPFDLSKVLFIATANQLGTIHPALLDRMEIIQLSGYTEEEKLHIARQYLIPRQLERTRPQARALDDHRRRAAPASSREYTREAGVRNLERQIGAIARKIAARVAEPAPDDGGRMPRHVVDRDRRARLPRAAAVPPGGLVPHVPARRRHRRGVDRNGRRRPLHRSQPAARREPANHPHRPARQRDAGIGARGRQSYPRQCERRLAYRRDFLDKHDLHVHVPAGAIPKDGPSAGVTIATAILSAPRNEAGA